MNGPKGLSGAINGAPQMWFLQSREEAGPSGVHSIFESTHVCQLMDRAQLKPGDHFFLQLCNINKTSKFKKFVLKREDVEPDVTMDLRRMMSRQRGGEDNQ